MKKQTKWFLSQFISPLLDLDDGYRVYLSAIHLSGRIESTNFTIFNDIPVDWIHRHSGDTRTPWNVYVCEGIQSIKGRPSVSGRLSAGAVSLVSTISCDIDVRNSHHGGARSGLCPSVADAITFLKSSVPLHPSVIVRTGGGVQAWWFLSEPVSVSDNARGIRKAWLDGLRAWSPMWRIDATHNVDRLMRLPGTFNPRGDAWATIVFPEDLRGEPYRYTVEDITEWVTPATDEGSSGVSRTIRLREEIGVPAFIKRILVDGEDEEFSALWEHTAVLEGDDCSQSVWDMRLACALMDYELSDSDIVEALRANRLIHSPDTRNKCHRVDYYARTLAKVHSLSSSPSSSAPSSPSPAASHVTPVPGPDSEEATLPDLVNVALDVDGDESDNDMMTREEALAWFRGGGYMVEKIFQVGKQAQVYRVVWENDFVFEVTNFAKLVSQITWKEMWMNWRPKDGRKKKYREISNQRINQIAGWKEGIFSAIDAITVMVDTDTMSWEEELLNGFGSFLESQSVEHLGSFVSQVRGEWLLDRFALLDSLDMNIILTKTRVFVPDSSARNGWTRSRRVTTCALFRLKRLVQYMKNDIMSSEADNRKVREGMNYLFRRWTRKVVTTRLKLWDYERIPSLYNVVCIPVRAIKQRLSVLPEQLTVEHDKFNAWYGVHRGQMRKLKYGEGEKKIRLIRG